MRTPMSCSSQDLRSQGASLYYLHEHANLFDMIRLVNILARQARSILRHISAEVGSTVWFKSAHVVTLFLWLDIWGYHLCRHYVSYFTYHLFNWWYLCYLVSIQVVESTISATATIDKSCDERLDVEKRFPSLVSYFVFHVVDNLLMHEIT